MVKSQSSNNAAIVLIIVAGFVEKLLIREIDSIDSSKNLKITRKELALKANRILQAIEGTDFISRQQKDSHEPIVFGVGIISNLLSITVGQSGAFASAATCCVGPNIRSKFSAMQVW